MLWLWRGEPACAIFTEGIGAKAVAKTSCIELRSAIMAPIKKHDKAHGKRKGIVTDFYYDIVQPQLDFYDKKEMNL